MQTFSVRACGRTRTRMRAAIFVHSVAGRALKMCVRVRAYTNFLVRTCADVCGRAPHGCGCGHKSGVQCACKSKLKHIFFKYAHLFFQYIVLFCTL